MNRQLGTVAAALCCAVALVGCDPCGNDAEDKRDVLLNGGVPATDRDTVTDAIATALNTLSPQPTAAECTHSRKALAIAGALVDGWSEEYDNGPAGRTAQQQKEYRGRIAVAGAEVSRRCAGASTSVTPGGPVTTTSTTPYYHPPATTRTTPPVYTTETPTTDTEPPVGTTESPDEGGDSYGQA